MSNVKLWPIVLIALLLYGLTVGCSGATHRPAIFDSYTDIDEPMVCHPGTARLKASRWEIYLCGCAAKIAVYGERYRLP